METIKAFKTKKAETVKVLKQLLNFLQDGITFGVDIETQLIKKVEEAILTNEKEKLKVALIGGFSEGKTSIAAAWSEHYDKSSMKIAHKESSDEVVVYSVGDDLDLIDTPGLFGFKETENKKKYKDITNKYISEANIILYVMNPNNPIKESHKEEIEWLFGELNLLDRTVFVLSCFDQEVDIEDEQDYQNGLEIKRSNVLKRLVDFGAIMNSQELPIVAVSANPFDQGITYWLDHIDEFKRLSHIETLQKATTEKIELLGGHKEIVLATQKSIVKDVLYRQLPNAQKKYGSLEDEFNKLGELHKEVSDQFSKTSDKIRNARIDLKDNILNYFTDLILQLKGTSLDTFDEFFERNIGDKGIVLDTKIENMFESEVGFIAREINKTQLNLKEGVDRYNGFADDMKLKGMQLGSKALKNARISNVGVKAVRDALKLPIKFKPWQAVKVAKAFNKAIPVVGELASLGFEVWESYSRHKKEEEFRKVVNEIKVTFDKQRKEYLDFIGDENKFKRAFFENYLILEKQQVEIEEELKKIEIQKNKFASWLKDAQIIEAEFEML
ncbi:MAG: hypothetical protein CSA15_09195 [Candidatus Delongbacteria bacterium]|nr:MAG: hypothetical protein CSA15_09195 [Candidatus Delongbacteria bacterium]